MARYELKLPEMGESVAEATITAWLKEVGDTVEADESVVEVATDKVDSEVPSEMSGVIKEILFQVDDVVKVGQVIAVIETEEEDTTDQETASLQSQEVVKETQKEEVTSSEHSQNTEKEEVKEQPEVEDNKTTLSQSAQEEIKPSEILAEEKEEVKIEETPLAQEDTNIEEEAFAIEKSISEVQQDLETPLSENISFNDDVPEEERDDDYYMNKFYSPLVRNIAKKEGITLQELNKMYGTGLDGRVTKDDILMYIEVRKKMKAQEEKPISNVFEKHFENISPELSALHTETKEKPAEEKSVQEVENQVQNIEHQKEQEEIISEENIKEEIPVITHAEENSVENLSQEEVQEVKEEQNVGEQNQIQEESVNLEVSEELEEGNAFEESQSEKIESPEVEVQTEKTPEKTEEEPIHHIEKSFSEEEISEEKISNEEELATTPVQNFVAENQSSSQEEVSEEKITEPVSSFENENQLQEEKIIPSEVLAEEEVSEQESEEPINPFVTENQTEEELSLISDKEDVSEEKPIERESIFEIERYTQEEENILSEKQEEKETPQEVKNPFIIYDDDEKEPIEESSSNEALSFAEEKDIQIPQTEESVTEHFAVASSSKSEEKELPKVEEKQEPREEQKEEIKLKAGEELIPMSRMGKLISEHMTRSKQVSAHVQSFSEADVTRIWEWRNKVKYKFEAREHQKFTFTPIFLSAVAKALQDFPMMNISVVDDKIIKKSNINIGMATALPDGNLIVPVIKNADRLSLTEMAKAVNDLANRARNGELKPDEIQDGTYTVTNIGSFGNIFGTPIINQPQVGILALGAIRKVPSVIETPAGDAIAIRYKMMLSHSYDHRVVNGALGGMFVQRVAEYLEKWDTERVV